MGLMWVFVVVMVPFPRFSAAGKSDSGRNSEKSTQGRRVVSPQFTTQSKGNEAAMGIFIIQRVALNIDLMPVAFL